MPGLKHAIEAGLRKAKNSVVLPLIAGMVFYGCSDCYTHNKTTMKLNRPVDGYVASMQTLEEELEGDQPSEAFIDLLNETHALSSGSMPHKAYATAVPASCLDGHPEWTTDTSFIGIDRGMYFPSLRFTMMQLSTVNHGLGHLQAQGQDNEAIAQLNETEQMLIGYQFFMDGDHGPLDIVRWAAYAHAFGLEALIARVMEKIKDGNELNTYLRMDALQYSLLLEHDGDYGVVRGRIERLVENETLEREARPRIARLEAWYAEVSGQGGNASAEATLLTKKAGMMEMMRLFGEEAARTYWEANARLLNGGLVYEQFSGESGETSISDGLRGGRVCEITAEEVAERKRPCGSTSRVCTMVDGESVEQMNLALCCMTADIHSEELAFRRTAANVEAFRYSKASGPVTLDGLGWRHATLLEIKSETVLGDGGYCTNSAQGSGSP